MSTRDTDISDETLTAYLDGELSQAEADMIADAIVDSPPLAARLSALEVPISELRPAFENMLYDMPAGLLPAYIEDVKNAPRPWIGKTAASIAAALVLAVGIGVGVSLPDRETATPEWHAYVAAYQALYVADTLNTVDQTPQETQAQLDRVASRLGRDLDVAQNVPGLDYKRGQVLGFEGKPLVQLAYLGAGEVPFALCIMPIDEAASLENMRLEGMEAASWSDGTFAYLLIGGQDSQVVATAAAHLQAAL